MEPATLKVTWRERETVSDLFVWERIREVERVEWVGDPGAPLVIDSWSAKNLLPRMPYQFEKIDHDVLYRTETYIRLDAGMWYAYHRFVRDWNNFVLFPLQWVAFRLILTLQVWGLAYIHPCEMPSWDCIGRRKR